MANLRTTTDIVQDVLFRIGEQQNNTSDFYSQVVSDVNRVYHALCTGGDELFPDMDEAWWWLRKATPGVLTLKPSFNSGTVAATLGSTSIAFSTIPTDYTGAQVSLQGWFFDITGDNGDIYQITGHIAGQTSATLDSPYTYTSQSAAAFRAFLMEYSLASDLRTVIGPMRCYQESRFEINYAEKQAMRYEFPLNTVPVGEPRLYSMIAEQKVQFSHYPGDDNTRVMRVEYDYNVLEGDLVDDGGLTAPLTPPQYNRVLSDWATYLNMLNKDDSRVDTVITQAKNSLLGMLKEQRRRTAKMGNTMGQIYTRQRDRWQNGQPLRTQAGLIIGW